MLPATKNRRRASVLFTAVCVLLTLVVGALLLVLREMNHRTLNRQLIMAVHDLDYKQALALVDQGATGEARENDAPPATIKSWLKSWWHKRTSLSAAGAAANPCALDLLYKDLQSMDISSSKPPPAAAEQLAISLVLHGSPIDDLGNCGYGAPLFCAALWHQHRVVEVLLSAGDPPDGDPLGSLLPICDLHDGELLLRYGADTKHMGNNDTFALANPDTQVVRLLLRHGAKVNARNQSGDTPLIEACNAGRTDTARVLLRTAA
jgi:hypothetical protein